MFCNLVVQPILSAGYAVNPTPEGEGDTLKAPSGGEGGKGEKEELFYPMSDHNHNTTVLNLLADEVPRALRVIMGGVNKYVDKNERGFAVVDQKLGDGICGAPVLNREGKCVGMVEGVVPSHIPNLDDKDELQKALADNMGFIYGRQIRKLLEEAKEDEGFKDEAYFRRNVRGNSGGPGRRRRRRARRGEDDDNDDDEGPLNPFKWLE